ncbi:MULTISPECIES: hypothetical protein [Vibrio]|jgi:hypothetical protein|uniref:DUF3551 domain-containing protein n=1 Tax=Vibrio barjaei TaxID=1676683 RepID=A0ABW7IKI8_9VIBR|nr:MULTISPECIES: hypothetical protein [Vibrio]EDL51160.1 hypothetical protein VSAK1_08838 [Vibrio mediterranei AK1]MCG9626311.1 hypothetical protein [Vibrio mediterranei]MCG9786028.1 hypothetical protein [Vibrio mediterranei]MCY9851718.1 hypothetical protein [Vibrio mediterranei]MCY9869415.1 hypothetical protein [Vibrio barjaei]
MKIFSALIFGIMLTLAPITHASNSSALGPYVDCQLSDGSQTYTPIERCERLGGQKRF